VEWKGRKKDLTPPHSTGNKPARKHKGLHQSSSTKPARKHTHRQLNPPTKKKARHLDQLSAFSFKKLLLFERKKGQKLTFL
jgi:hypothetical protein